MTAFLSVLVVGFLLHSGHCEEFGISLPKQMEVTYGSCLTIPCSFTIQDTYEQLLTSECRALWRTVNSDQTVEFTRATTGDLTQKNCTTTVHEITKQQGGQVHFRLDCDSRLKATFRQSSVDIKVNEAPPKPTLTPPTLSVTEGQSVRLQCSAAVPCLSLPPTLTWSPVLGDIQETLLQQQDRTFVKVSTLSFSASDYETSLTCSAVHSREDGTTVSSVSETAKVTCAQCDKFSVSLPQNICAVRGSSLTIPCSFKILDKFKLHLNDSCKAMWIDTCYKPIIPPGQTTGDLAQKNCTTTFQNIGSEHNQKHFFRVECDNDLKWTYRDTSVNIQVIEAPPKPTLAPPTLSVTEGQSVKLQCSAPVPCLSLPPTLTWSPVLGDIQETLQQQQDRTFVKVSTLSFTASHSHHKSNISCSAGYSRDDGSVSRVSAHMTPFVKSQPTNTRVSVSPSGPVAEHSDVTLSCSSDARPAVLHYRWYKTDGGSLTLIGDSALLNMKASTDTSVLCEALNEVGTDRSSVTQLNVQYGPRNTRVAVHPHGSVTEHSNVTLRCSSDARPAVHHLWYKVDKGSHTLIGNSSVLSVQATKDTTAVVCEAQSELGTDRSIVTQLDVQFSAQILSSSNCTGDLSQRSCWCEAVGNPSPLIQWHIPGVFANISITNEALSDTSVRSVITVKEPQWREPTTLICHSSNSLGSDQQTITTTAFRCETIGLEQGAVIISVLIAIKVVILLVFPCIPLVIKRIPRTPHDQHQPAELVVMEQLPVSNEVENAVSDVIYENIQY